MRADKVGPVPGDGAVTKPLGSQDGDREARSAANFAEVMGGDRIDTHEYDPEGRDGKVGQ